MNVIQKSSTIVAVGAMAMATSIPVLVECAYESSDFHSHYFPSKFSGADSGPNLAGFAGVTQPVAESEETVFEAVNDDNDDYDFGDPEPVSMNRDFVRQLVTARISDQGFNSSEA